MPVFLLLKNRPSFYKDEPGWRISLTALPDRANNTLAKDLNTSICMICNFPDSSEEAEGGPYGQKLSSLSDNFRCQTSSKLKAEQLLIRHYWCWGKSKIESRCSWSDRNPVQRLSAPPPTRFNSAQHPLWFAHSSIQLCSWTLQNILLYIFIRGLQ